MRSAIKSHQPGTEPQGSPEVACLVCPLQVRAQLWGPAFALRTFCLVVVCYTWEVQILLNHHGPSRASPLHLPKRAHSERAAGNTCTTGWPRQAQKEQEGERRELSWW